MTDFSRAQYDQSFLTQNKRDFHAKEQRFRAKVCRLLWRSTCPTVALQTHVQPGQCLLVVQRSNLFRSSFLELFRLSSEDLQRRLAVRFEGEGLPHSNHVFMSGYSSVQGGLDYGGLAREWVFLVSREILHPRSTLDHCPAVCVLFSQCAASGCLSTAATRTTDCRSIRTRPWMPTR